MWPFTYFGSNEVQQKKNYELKQENETYKFVINHEDCMSESTIRVNAITKTSILKELIIKLEEGKLESNTNIKIPINDDLYVGINSNVMFFECILMHSPVNTFKIIIKDSNKNEIVSFLRYIYDNSN